MPLSLTIKLSFRKVIDRLENFVRVLKGQQVMEPLHDSAVLVKNTARELAVDKVAIDNNVFVEDDVSARAVHIKEYEIQDMEDDTIVFNQWAVEKYRNCPFWVDMPNIEKITGSVMDDNSIFINNRIESILDRVEPEIRSKIEKFFIEHM